MDIEPIDVITPINAIRTETVLSRLPVHRLAKRGAITIEIKRRNKQGQISLHWRVKHNPGALAYKIDTLIVNRRIDEARPVIPKLIRLGSLREIADELGRAATGNTDEIKEAILQNVGAIIHAKLTYKTNDGREKFFEFATSRYAAIFTGENLPDGRKADAVYIELHDRYQQMLLGAPTRPLDYDYLKDLPPGAQRLYELISFQIFAALKNDLPRAKYRYSDLCLHAPFIRHYEREKVRKQLFKIHALHIKAKYIAKVELEEASDGGGEPDWFIFYTPGTKAQREYKVFTSKRELTPSAKSAVHQEGKTGSQQAGKPAKQRQREGSIENEETSQSLTLSQEEKESLAVLCKFGVSQSAAVRLIKNDIFEVRRQLQAWPHRNKQGMTNPAAILRRFIENHEPLPDEVARAIKKSEEVERGLSKKAFEESRTKHEVRFREAYSDYLTSRIGQVEIEHPEAYSAFLEATREERERTSKVLRSTPNLTQRMFEAMALQYFHKHSDCPILDFWEWDAQMNPEPFKYDA